MWFDSVQAAEVAGSAEWATVIEDARGFMDFSRLVVAWAEEVSVLPTTAGPSSGLTPPSACSLKLQPPPQPLNLARRVVGTFVDTRARAVKPGQEGAGAPGPTACLWMRSYPAALQVAEAVELL